MRVPYKLLRALELSGRWPQDSGEWLSYVYRLWHGEGAPPKGHALEYVRHSEGDPLPHAPKISNQVLGLSQVLAYRRLRSGQDIRRLINANRLGQAAFQIFAGWAYPHDGIIPHPESFELPLRDTHAIQFEGVSDRTGLIEFSNSWGEWGRYNLGTGYVDFAYVDRYCIEAIGRYFHCNVISRHTSPLPQGKLTRWSFNDEWSRKFFVLQYLHPVTEDRRGWAFLVENNHRLELEEFYVLPEHRGKGIAGILVSGIRELCRAKRLPLTVLVPFSETRQEAPQTYDAMIHVLKKLQITYKQSDSKLVGYWGANDLYGEEVPVEPHWIPNRPKSIPAQVVAAAIGLAGPEVFIGTIDNLNQVQIEQRERHFEMGWERMNLRRAALIHRKNRDGIDDSEASELRSLQSLSVERMNRDFPRPALHDAMLRQILDSLGQNEEA